MHLAVFQRTLIVQRGSAPKVWNSCVTATAEFLEEKLAEAMRHLTVVINYEGRETDAITLQASLTYVRAAKQEQPIVKLLTLLGAKLMTAAASTVEQLRAASEELAEADAVLRELVKQSAKTEKIEKAEFGAFLRDMRASTAKVEHEAQNFYKP
eukprot:6491531-Amphidinium_carterae.1